MTKTTTTRTIVIHTLRDGMTFELTDAEQPYASIVIEQFKAGHDLTFPYEGATGYVPYHAIQYIGVEETKTSSTIEDDFCVTDSSDDGGSDESGQ